MQDPDLLCPAEVDHLQGDASKAREKLGPEPTVTLKEMLAEMVEETSDDKNRAWVSWCCAAFSLLVPSGSSELTCYLRLIQRFRTRN